jgi:nucleoid-associated protein YgaU
MSETATEPTAPEGGQPAEPGTAEPAGDAPLGAAGEKALAEWKQRAKAAERESKTHAARLQQLEDRDKSEAQKAAERATAAEQRAAAMAQRAAKAEVRALAASTFADPSDAAAFLDLSEFVDDTGDIDSKGIEKALADLLKRKPHLGKEATPPSFDGGARTTAGAPTDMNALIRSKAGLG